ncbi:MULTISPECIES: MurR/RpiR family transcriptional regulator [unclassified Niallia]|uniref:MurR/RpiR family transcriptional regulator n=1 Tax=unclassified Niallia TaxID=2837522 RepID=UPI001EDC8EBC|nr:MULTISPECIES: MurR/RpiR family transcriptional regulator [unclassified Niallia]MCM3032291.1 MurR/RpiR family transcriptional regulator [Niallia sp. MER 6]MDL0435356.1 MurR/RpiR family transcriptional regulator [Niallia sp. SS-2023]UPO87550.1 MurR/RpiR family transcriptional regulator [Niallia sp. Man26]
MNILLKRLAQSKGELSELEKQVLDYIIANPALVAESSLDHLSKALFISTATISRTCKRLGFSGFQDLKYSLNKDSEQELYKEAVHPPSFLTAHMDRVKQEMEWTLEHINELDIHKAASFIHESNFIEFFGVGASLPTCIDAARKLTFAGIICNAREDWDELRCVANGLSNKDLAILVSYSGETAHILDYAAILKERAVKTIAIVGRKSSRLKDLADITFQARIQNCYLGDLDMSSRFPLSILLDFIILTALESGKTGQKASRA